jgi:hypothetical protein
MNDVTFVEAARKLAERMIREGGTDPLTYGFRVVTARRPSPDELRVLADGLAYHRDYFSTDATRAAEFLKQGESPVDASMDTSELAAYAAVASLMLNLDEASAKE